MDSKIFNEVRNKLKAAVRKKSAQGLLFSGGLDTSILFAVCPELTAIHVSLENYGSDIKYAKIVENFLNLKVYHAPSQKRDCFVISRNDTRRGGVYYLTIKIQEAIESIPEIIKILKSFDPAIPNDIPVYFGLKLAKKLGLKSIMTGDGSDELFAGYDYMKNITDLNVYIRNIAKNMYFSSNELGKHFGIEIKQPYLDKEFRDFSLEIPINLKIKKEKNQIFGKWVLRKAFENLLPGKIIWQDKRPLEYGSGMTKLREIISRKISDDKFTHLCKFYYPIKFINKEHLYYYEIYKDVIGKIPKPKENEKKCPACGGRMGIFSSHCKICGYVLICKM